MSLWRRKNNRQKRVAQNPKIVLIRQIVVGALLVLLLGLIGTGVWYGTRIDALTIDAVEVIGGETIEHAMLQEIAAEELSGSYYRLVPKRFAWTYPRESIYARIAELERVKNVRVERISGKKIAIAFEEYHPFALWCETLTTNECLFLDREGYAFGTAPKLQGGAFVRFSEQERPPQLRTQAFPGEYVREAEAFITRAYDELELNIIQMEKVTEDEVTYHIAGGGELKVSLRMSTDDTIDNLKTILFSEEFDHIAPGNFQYIDLRYGNKIFVNEEEPISEEVASTTASTTGQL